MIVLTIVLAILGIAVLTVGIMALTGNLPGNSAVGLRIPEVRKSKENWIMGHKIAGPAWAGAGAVLLGAALLSAKVSGWMWLVLALLVVGAVFLLGLGAALASHTMARVDAQRLHAEAAAEDAAGGCCGGSGAADSGTDSCGDVASAEACASGNACGSCALNGSCEGGGAAFDAAKTSATTTAKPQVDMDAARRAVAQRNI
ncbi:SdpI family protein [Corynebacterium auriscanis]|uniref:SdpI family protein n=1 Tax=Corynebacterium auriscanis TaxID=99807 RepID=UPI003CE6B357